MRHSIKFLVPAVCLLPIGTFADSRLPEIPPPSALIQTQDCHNFNAEGWGWDGQQGCRISRYRFDGETDPLVQSAADYTPESGYWSRVDVAGKTIRCDNFSRRPRGVSQPYSRQTFDLTFVEDDAIPAAEQSENFDDVTGHLFLRGWSVFGNGQLNAGYLVNFNDTSFRTEQGYIFIHDSFSSRGTDIDTIQRFSHCYLRDEAAPLRANGGCVDHDGDGIGWNGAVCEVTVPTNDNCDYSAAIYNAGWGYNPVTQQSCPPLADSPGFTPEDACEQIGPDGWGWNSFRQESCRLE
jgi:hypothetical protein